MLMKGTARQESVSTKISSPLSPFVTLALGDILSAPSALDGLSLEEIREASYLAPSDDSQPHVRGRSTLRGRFEVRGLRMCQRPGSLQPFFLFTPPTGFLIYLRSLDTTATLS